MSTVHRFTVIAQIFTFIGFALMFALFKLASPGITLIILSGFIGLEFLVLYHQSLQDPAEVRYRKSCIFALADLTAALAFMALFVWTFTAWIGSISLPSKWAFITVFLYTAIRKYYISTQYGYEK